MENTSLQLEDLKVSNLPELQGWKEKQEKLVEENPYVEIVDNKTYDVACKSRTALLKGRTELEKQDKLIASKVASFRKEVKTETDNLIAITLPFEEKQQSEVKRYEGIKEAERMERERVENERIEGIKAKIDTIETDCFKIIQAMTFQNVILDGASIALICKTDFDFEEYEISYHQALLRIENAMTAKIEDLNEREEQRLAKEKAEEENRKLKAKQDLQSERLKLFAPYIHLITEDDEWSITELGDLSDSLFNVLLSSKQFLFDKFEKERKEAQNKLAIENLERENKAKADKEKIFEIRKGRLNKDGFILRNGFFMDEDSFCSIQESAVRESDVIDFETIITEACFVVESGKERRCKIEEDRIANEVLFKKDEERLMKENKARVKRLKSDKSVLDYSLSKIKDTFISEIAFVQFDNEETETFRKTVESRFDTLLNELLTELKNL